MLSWLVTYITDARLALVMMKMKAPFLVKNRPSNFALLLQHAHGFADRTKRIRQLGLVMGGGDEPTGAAAEIDSVDHHRQAQFVHDIGLAVAGQARRRLLMRVEPGRRDRDAIGVGEDVQHRKRAVS